MSREKDICRAKNLMDYADAVAEFFETIIGNHFADPKRVSEKLIKKYGLKGNQKKDLTRIAGRTSKAKKIVEWVREQYGVDKEGKIKDKDSLWEFLFPFHFPISRNFSVVPYSFAIGIYLPESCFPKGTLGGVAEIDNSERVQLLLLREELEEMEEKEGKAEERRLRRYMELRNLTFFVREETLTPEERLFCSIFGAEKRLQRIKQKSQEEVVRHELKHIIDNNLIIGFSRPPFGEVSATLFSRRYRTRGFISSPELLKWLIKRDIRCFRILRIAPAENRYKYLKKIGAPQLILDNQRDLLRKKYDVLKQMEGFLELFQEVLSKGLSQITLSFLLSLIPFEQLRENLELIASTISRSGN